MSTAILLTTTATRDGRVPAIGTFRNGVLG
jgi:hypothetical protein